MKFLPGIGKSERNLFGIVVSSFVLGCVATLLVIAFAAALVFYPVSVSKLGSVRFWGRHDVQGKPAALSSAGQIEAVELPLANTEGMLPDAAERLQPPRWVFANLTETRLQRLLRTCGFSGYEIRVLLGTPCFKVTDKGCEIAPPEFILWRLSKEHRQMVYSVLARDPNNYAQRNPFRFPPGTLAERLHLSGLQRREIWVVSRLTYTNYLGMECFADLQVARAALSTNAFNNLVGALYQTPAFILRLRVSPAADVDKLASYWGRGGREKLVEPLLKALRRVPGGGVINVSTLLPPFAQLRLFTFPDAWADPTAAQQDCVFTSLNFFNEQPDTNLLNADYVRKIMESDYAPVQGDSPAFGDLIVLMDEKTELAVHMCVYIADGFVFTKNGMSREQPWVLMQLADVLKGYFGQQPSDKIVILRHKDPDQRSSAGAAAWRGIRFLWERQVPA